MSLRNSKFASLIKKSFNLQFKEDTFLDNNVVLTLRMEQLDSEDGDGIINTYPAKYRKVGDWHVFSYEETVSSDPGDRTNNLIKIRDEEVILIK